MQPIRIATICALLIWFTPPLHASDNAQQLAEQIAAGGYSLFILPTQHRGGSLVAAPPPPECANDTRLSAKGWRDAREIGRGLLKKGVLVEIVTTSPACAARHTAYLLFGADRVRHDHGLLEACGGGRDSAAAKHLRELLQRKPPYPRYNLAVVGHGCNLRALVQTGWPKCARELKPGGVAVFRPTDGVNAEVVGCLSADTVLGWRALPR